MDTACNVCVVHALNTCVMQSPSDRYCILHARNQTCVTIAGLQFAGKNDGTIQHKMCIDRALNSYRINIKRL